jgi:hypothetical protein
MSVRAARVAMCLGVSLWWWGPTTAHAQRGVPAIFRPPAMPHLPSRRPPPSVLLDDDDGLGDLLDDLESAWEISGNFQSCLDEGGSPDDCAARVLLCDISPMGASAYYARLGGSFTTLLIEESHIFDAFRTSACGNDCFWCCLTPTGCHTSFGPSPVINCNLRYGLGSRTIGHTLITAVPTGTTACLAIPQTCDLYSQCAIAGSRGYPGGLPLPPPVGDAPPRAYGGYYAPEPLPAFTATDAGVADADVPDADVPDAGLDPAWTPPRGERELRPARDTPAPVLDAIADRKVRIFAESVARVTAEVLDTLPPDHALDEVSDMLSMRGCIGHRTLLQHGEPFDGTHAVFGSTVTDPRVRERVSTRRALHYLATVRVLSSVPNLRRRFLHVESRLWTATERAEYLRAGGVTDPDRTLRQSMSSLALRILQRVDGLQDYRLLAVALPGEAADVPRYNGCRLGTAPQVTVTAQSQGDQVVLSVTATERDPADPRVLQLPVAIEWGDDTTSRGVLPTGSLRGQFTHTYRAAGRYAAVVAVAGQSGLHGLAGLVLDAAGGVPTAPRAIGFERVVLPNLQVFAGNTGNRDPGSVHASLSLVEGANVRRIGRAPTREIEVRQTTITGGVETVVRPGLTSFGDVVGYNPGRVPAHHLEVRAGVRGGTAWDGRNLALRLRDLRFDLFSARRGEAVTHAVRLTPERVRAYYGAPPVLAAMTLPTDDEGYVRIPLVRADSTSGRTPPLDHIEVDLESLLASADLGNEPLSENAVGVRRRWSETRPGVLEAGPLEGLPLEDAGVSMDAGFDGGLAMDAGTPQDAEAPLPDRGAVTDVPAREDSAVAREDSAVVREDSAVADGGRGGAGGPGCGCRTEERAKTGFAREALAVGAALMWRRRRARRSTAKR